MWGAHPLRLYPVGSGPPSPKTHRAQHSSGETQSLSGATMGQEATVSM